jgi:hypothetical protein
METVRFRIHGISPLLMNSPKGMKRGGGGSVSTKQIPTPEAEAESKVYRLPDGTLYLPAIQFRGALLNAGKGRRIGKRGAMAVAAGAVFVTTDVVPLIDADGDSITDYEVDVQRVVVQGQGVMRARPLLRDWGCEIDFEIDTDFITADMAGEMLSIAGRIVGVGDYRPQHMGPYGRFEAKKVVEQVQKKPVRRAAALGSVG